jgi:SOS response regulatory protein OraA/RecX
MTTSLEERLHQTAKRISAFSKQHEEETDLRITSRDLVRMMRRKGFDNETIRAILEDHGLPLVLEVETPAERAYFRIRRRRAEGACDDVIRNELIARGLPTEGLS